MQASITPVKDQMALSGKKFCELPVGTVVNIEGCTYFRADNDIISIDVNGYLLTISDYLRDYLQQKIPKVVYGTMRFYPLG